MFIPCTYTYLLIFGKCVFIFDIFLNFFQGFSIHNVVISFDWKKEEVHVTTINSNKLSMKINNFNI